MTLSQIRKQIDTIDNDILNLILKRMHYSENIAEIKFNNNISILDKKREQDILNNIKLNVPDKYKYIIPIFEEILKSSKKIQEDIISNK